MQEPRPHQSLTIAMGPQGPSLGTAAAGAPLVAANAPALGEVLS